MLQGTFEIDGHALDLRGYDINNTIFLDAEVTGVGLNADSGRSGIGGGRERQFWDQGIDIDGDEYPADWGHAGLGISIGTTNIKLVKQEMRISKELKFKNIVNEAAFKTLGSLVRSAKNACGVWNYDSLTGTHVIPGGRVSLVNGELVAVDVEMETIYGMAKLHLKDVEAPVKQVNIFKSGHSLGIEVDLFTPEAVVVDESRFDGGDDNYYTVKEVIQRRPEKSYAWLMERDYTIVTPETLDSTVRYLWQTMQKDDRIGAFDVETTGLDITFRSREGMGSQLVGMVFSVKEGESFYFPISHKLMPNIGPSNMIAALIDRYFKPLLERKRWSGHNVSFDWKTMYIYDINTNFVFDTMTAARLSLWNDQNNFPLNLKGGALRILGRDSLELDDFVEGGWDKNKSFADLPADSVKYYACADTDNTLDLTNWYINEKIIEKYGIAKVFEIEVLFSRAIGYSEFYGMYGNPERITKLDEELSAIADAKLAEMRETLAWPEFNPRSPAQVSKALYDDLGMPVLKTTDAGGRSADKATLKRLLDIVGPDEQPLYPFVKVLQEYRDAANLVSNFTSVYDKVSKNGFFFASVNQFLETGRVSVKEPNYQSFNDVVKRYIEPRRGFYMFDTDFSSVEYRILVSIAGEQKLVDQFFDPDFDYHREMASMLYEIPYNKVTPAIRGQSKGLNFGIPYGMTIFGLATRMFGDDSNESVSKANRLYKKYFSSQDNVREFFDKTKDQAVDKGYNETAFGRRRYYDKRKSNEKRIRRQAGNHPIQGTAADLYKLGVGRLFIKIFQGGLDGKVLINAFVHDECVIEVHQSVHPITLLGIVRDSMMTEIPGWCPLYIGAGYGKSWYEAKKTELPVQVQEQLMEEGIGEWDGDIDALNVKFHQMIADFYVKAVKDWARTVDSEREIPPAEQGFIKSALDYAKSDVIIADQVQAEVPDYDTVLESFEVFQTVFGATEMLEGGSVVEELEPVEVDMDNYRVEPGDVHFQEEDPMELLRARIQLTGAVKSPDREVFIRYVETDPGWGQIVGKLLEIHSDTTDAGMPVKLIDDSGNVHETPHTVSIKILSAVTKQFLGRKLVGK